MHSLKFNSLSKTDKVGDSVSVVECRFTVELLAVPSLEGARWSRLLHGLSYDLSDKPSCL